VFGVLFSVYSRGSTTSWVKERSHITRVTMVDGFPNVFMAFLMPVLVYTTGAYTNRGRRFCVDVHGF
jgi:hypothetical protein